MDPAGRQIHALDRRELEARRRGVNEEQRHAFRRARGDQQHVGHVGPRDEAFRAGQGPALRRLLRSRRHRRRLPVEIVVEERHGRARLAGRDRRKPTLLLRVVAGRLDGGGGEDSRKVRPGIRGAAELFEQDRGLDHAEPASAVGLGQGEPEPAELGHLLPHRLALTARIVPQETNGRGLAVLVEKRARRVLQELLVRAEGEVHGVRPSAGRRALPSAGRARALR